MYVCVYLLLMLCARHHISMCTYIPVQDWDEDHQEENHIHWEERETGRAVEL